MVINNEGEKNPPRSQSHLRHRAGNLKERKMEIEVCYRVTMLLEVHSCSRLILRYTRLMMNENGKY